MFTFGSLFTAALTILALGKFYGLFHYQILHQTETEVPKHNDDDNYHYLRYGPSIGQAHIVK